MILSDDFPPHSRDRRTVDAVASAFAAIMVDSTAIYVSSPITTGRLYFTWRRGAFAELDPTSPEYKRAHVKGVIEPNSRAAAAVVEKVRKRGSAPVIDPTAFTGPSEWTQDDYRELWAKVIVRYVATIIFVEDWQYSNGCAYEYLTATKAGIEVFDTNYEGIPLRTALHLMQRAIDELSANGENIAFLEAVKEQLSLAP